WHLTHLGDAWLLTALVVLAALFLVRERRRLDAIVLCAGASAAGLLTTALKLAFQRSRPLFLDHARVLHSFSFPSGHASGAFAVYVLLALVLTEGLARRWRIAAVLAALALGTLVGGTRVVIVVHYLTDVFAGAA